MQKLRVLIVDDEEPGRNNLENLITRYCGAVEIVGKAGSAIEARSLLLQEKPNLLFLDIEMPNENGIELLESMGNTDCRTVFVTAHKQYAIKALKLEAMDYLLKPVSIRELQLAIQKAEEQLQQKKSTASPENQSDFISISINNGYEVIPKKDIIRLEGANNYTIIIAANNKRYTISRTLKDFESVLGSKQFVRTHKAHIVNLAHVIKISQHDSKVVMADGSRIEVSRRRYHEFLQMLGYFAPILR